MVNFKINKPNHLNQGIFYTDKKEILAFKALHQDITYDWQTIRSKVLNERMAHNKRRKVGINKMRL